MTMMAALGHLPRRFDRGMIRRVDIDSEQPVDLVRILIQRIAEDRETGIHHKNVERPAAAHAGDHRVPVGAVGEDGDAACFRRQLLRRIPRAGVGESHLRAVAGKAPDDGGADAPAATEYEN